MCQLVTYTIVTDYENELHESDTVASSTLGAAQPKRRPRIDRFCCESIGCIWMQIFIAIVAEWPFAPGATYVQMAQGIVLNYDQFACKRKCLRQWPCEFSKQSILCLVENAHLLATLGPLPLAFDFSQPRYRRDLVRSTRSSRWKIICASRLRLVWILHTPIRRPRAKRTRRRQPSRVHACCFGNLFYNDSPRPQV